MTELEDLVTSLAAVGDGDTTTTTTTTMSVAYYESGIDQHQRGR